MWEKNNCSVWGEPSSETTKSYSLMRRQQMLISGKNLSQLDLILVYPNFKPCEDINLIKVTIVSQD